MSDIIAAISTAAAPSAIGVLRLTGPGCAELVAKVFKPMSGRDFDKCTPRKMIYGTLYDNDGAVLDRPLAFFTPGPNSYTGEDCAEIHCHGSPLLLTEALAVLLANGARQAQAGEFTRRAFLNGRMDLTAAEAVIDLIEAETPETARNAAGQLAGAMSRKIDGIYESLVQLIAHFQAIIDYPDEDIEPLEAAEMSQTLQGAADELDALLRTYERGRFLTDGIPAAIIGSPNSGKSTLLNALLGYERAIVTPIAGTTRDTIRERVRLGGVLLRLSDTAGIHSADDPVEAMGIERSRQAAQQAELSLLMLDGSRQLSESDLQAYQAAKLSGHTLVLINKTDLPQVLDISPLGEAVEPIYISAANAQGLDELEVRIEQLFPRDFTGRAQGEILTNFRHKQAVQNALESVRAARSALAAGVTPDAVLSDAELALGHLAQLTGRQVSQDIISDIFSRFCVGK